MSAAELFEQGFTAKSVAISHDMAAMSLTGPVSIDATGKMGCVRSGAAGHQPIGRIPFR